MSDLLVARGNLVKLNSRKSCFEIEAIESFSAVCNYIERLTEWTDSYHAGESQPVMLAGGGGVVFDHLGNVVLIKRSQTALTNPGKWTLPTGRFDSEEELLNPELMLREVDEELLVRINGVLNPVTKVFGIGSFSQKFGSGHIDTLEIKYRETKNSIKCWLSINDTGRLKGEINTLIPIYSDENISGYEFNDGESIHGRSMNREVKIHNQLRTEALNEIEVTEQTLVALRNIKLLHGGFRSVTE